MPDPTRWGVSDAEAARHLPCDDLVPHPRATWLRGVTVRAPAPTVYRWLCQLRVAPYSYDLLDNPGRRSPRTLTPGAERLAVGQRVMTIFELVSFAPGEHLTVRMRRGAGQRAFGEFTLTYDVRETAPGTTRLVCKLLLGGAPGALHEARRRALARGDLLMMRKQLLTLRHLAEGSARAGG
ncbi:hypothetical protein [Kineococcus arenarius]|uniref:hypothetical protein n=1 Tax=unclassified Kineococcus TaxID=2621656 RepID=UPI003D7D36CB